MVGRGIMLDVPSYRNVDHMGPGEVVTGGEFDAIAAHQGTEVRQGDIVGLGKGVLYRYDPVGISDSLSRQLSGRVARGEGYLRPRLRPARSRPRLPAASRHKRPGIYLVANVALEELASDKVYEFLFVGAPLPLTHAPGTPWSTGKVGTGPGQYGGAGQAQLVPAFVAELAAGPASRTARA